MFKVEEMELPDVKYTPYGIDPSSSWGIISKISRIKPEPRSESVGSGKEHESSIPLYPWREKLDIVEPNPWYIPKASKNGIYPLDIEPFTRQDKKDITISPSLNVNEKHSLSIQFTSKGIPKIKSQNYSAMEIKGTYGLIDMGVTASGIRSFICHVPKSKNMHYPLNNIKTGNIIHVIKKGTRESVMLRVRYTTPTRYYSPGAKITTLTIGVDERDW